jgi:hypothetical protein
MIRWSDVYWNAIFSHLILCELELVAPKMGD